MEKLACPTFRNVAGVHPTNIYLFPSTQNSEEHIVGWHSVKTVISKLSLKNPDNITATSNRHRISYLHADLDVEEEVKTLFYEFMGHSKQMNKSRYQAPLSAKIISRLGANLEKFDRGGEEDDEDNDDDKFECLTESQSAKNEKVNSDNQTEYFSNKCANDNVDFKKITSNCKKEKELKTKIYDSKVNEKLKIVENSIQEEENVNHYQVNQRCSWNEIETNLLIEEFNDFITEKVKQWPTREKINTFTHKVLPKKNYNVVRTKIINLRNKERKNKIQREKRREDRLKSMNVPTQI
ncbi:DNA ligase 1-like isoform X2 [Hydra vulgaris]|uniref:DNA ligase 1-like isoform X2 n=1 Tax=Hydra vulgaris TaxID=6087 RepID=A0ABM4C800_HYDVU